MRLPSHTLVYDGACALCRRFAAYVSKSDRGGVFEIRAYQEEGIGARFPWIDGSRFARAMQLVGPGRSPSETWEGARAVEEVARLLPGVRRLAWIFRLPLVRPGFAKAYGVFARNRRRFGCAEEGSCARPGERCAAAFPSD